VTPAHHRRLASSLAAATLVPIGVLGWLGIRVLDQERDVERERQREELHVAGLRVAVDLERHLQAIEAALTRGEGLVFSNAGIAAISTDALLYQPTSGASPRLPPELLEAERAEHQSLEWTRAAAAYRRVAGSAEPELRAAALLGLGRVLRKAGEPDRALKAFTELEALGTVLVADQPAALVARQARILLLERAGHGDRLREEAVALGDALIRGGWAIDRAMFDTCWELVTRHAEPATLPPDAVARTDAAIRLWHAWRSGEWPSSGRRLLADHTGSTLALWSGPPARPMVAVIPLARLGRDLQARVFQPAARVSASDADGRHLFGPAGAGGISLLPSETRLPFVLHVAAADNGPATGLRRGVLLTVLSLAFVLMTIAAYSLYRTTSRELKLVQQQRDFVSAVSHEFRTPLTSMRHLADLLVSRDIANEERRAHYYRLLAHETDRLHRMVENLLSFGRIGRRVCLAPRAAERGRAGGTGGRGVRSGTARRGA
jgi:signal transduction histidine kinase